MWRRRLAPQNDVSSNNLMDSTALHTEYNDMSNKGMKLSLLTAIIYQPR